MIAIKGFLIDLDGVLYTGNRLIDGAVEAIDFLRDNEYPFRCVSNSTRKCRRTLVNHLVSLGLDIPESKIFTPPLAATAHMKKSGRTACYLLLTDDAARDFSDVKTPDTGTGTDWVVIGDAGDKITYERMNTAFRFLVEGAELLALENDRYWMAADGLSLSAGPFACALEYASGKKATVMGKPSTDFFNLALEDMQMRPEEVAMIGDDITTDIGGASRAGMRGILVKTGKYRSDTLDAAAVKPTFIVDSIADVPRMVQKGSFGRSER